MGTLRPGAEIIYESPDGGDTVFGRYRDNNERFLVGYSIKKQQQRAEEEDVELWHNIRRAASNNEELKNLLERVKILYYLSKKDGQE
jgi:hypothetical protein